MSHDQSIIEIAPSPTAHGVHAFIIQSEVARGVWVKTLFYLPEHRPLGMATAFGSMDTVDPRTDIYYAEENLVDALRERLKKICISEEEP